jgi:hypothetical protein
VRHRRFFIAATLKLLVVCGAACAQETDLDPNRVFTTELRWERVAGAPHNEKLRYAGGTLVILYREGVYAEVAASFIKNGRKNSVGLNLNEGFIVHLGTWSRTEDEVLIRILSREVVREKQIRRESCQDTPRGRVCSPTPEAPLPGLLLTNTCRLEHPSMTHVADAIVCSGLTVFHSRRSIDLSDLPSMVRQLVERQKNEPGSSTR